MSESTDLTYYQKNINVILNRAKDYYKYNKQRLMIQAREITETYLKKNKIKKREYAKNRYRNMSEEQKPKLKEY